MAICPRTTQSFRHTCGSRGLNSSSLEGDPPKSSKQGTELPKKTKRRFLKFEMSSFNSFSIPFEKASGKGPGPRNRKRKRGTNEIESHGLRGATYESGDEETQIKTKSDGGGDTLSPAADLVHEDALAPGWPAGASIPPPPFPYAPIPLRHSTSLPTLSDRRAALANLNPPLAFDPSQEVSSRAAPKQQHVAVLTTILHRCLLRRDWLRAGRAFGMLLRTEVAGQGVEIRRHGLWGIGAEILLRSEGQIKAEMERKEGKVSGSQGGEHVVDGNEPNFFTPEGFERARRYYERLIIQFPTRHWDSHDMLSATNFYRAMFGLWIAFIQDQRKKTCARVQERQRSPVTSSGSHASDENDERPGKVGAKIFQQVRELSKTLEDLKYPYHDDPELHRLQLMVRSWLRDLVPDDASDSNLGTRETDTTNMLGNSAALPMASPRTAAYEASIQHGEGKDSSDTDEESSTADASDVASLPEG